MAYRQAKCRRICGRNTAARKAVALGYPAVLRRIMRRGKAWARETRAGMAATICLLRAKCHCSGCAARDAAAALKRLPSVEAWYALITHILLKYLL